MIGIVIVSHGNICASLRDALTEIMGDLPNVTVVGIKDDCTRDQQKRKILDAIARVNTGGGVVLASDLIGATPYNICTEVTTDCDIRHVHGVNLPFLVSLCGSSNQPIDLAITRALSKGQVALGRQKND